MNKLDLDILYLSNLIKAFSLIDISPDQSSIKKIIDLVVDKCINYNINKEDIFNELHNNRNKLPDQLESIYCNVFKEGNIHKKRYIIPQIIGIDEQQYPSEETKKTPDNLINNLIEDIDKLPPSTIHILSENFLSLLLKYGANIPSHSEKKFIPLYDYTKTQIAILLSEQMHNNGTRNSDEPFILIGGDMSGIQDYIYQIVSKHAAKNLKGRSFYIKLLCDTVVRYIISELNLYNVHLIYNSGGCFYIIAPNTKEITDKLDNAILFIENHLYNTHGISLFLAIDYIVVSKETLEQNGDKLKKAMNQLFRKRDDHKASKFEQIIVNNPELFFTPSESGGTNETDSITGEEIPTCEKAIKHADMTLRPINHLQIKMGQALKSTSCMIVSNGHQIEGLSDCLEIEPLKMGIHYYLITDKSRILNIKSDHSFCVITFNDTNYIQNPSISNAIYELSFYGGNETGRMGSNFEKMVGDTDDSRLIRNGVLRMDVDNLGSIFQNGLSLNDYSLSSLSTLSRNMDLFFSGHINRIWRKMDPDSTFIIYSGGDDLFIVGQWDKTIQLAETIRNEFRKYTAYNPAFSISGGVSIIEKKFPIMKGAQLSGEEEDNAKGHACGLFEKNSISFLNNALNWDFEYPVIHTLKNTIYEMLTTKKLPMAFPRKIMDIYSIAEIKDHKVTQYKTYWMMAYTLARFKERYKDSVNIIDNCTAECSQSNSKTINGIELSSNYHPLELWTIACRWAELTYRTYQKNIN